MALDTQEKRANAARVARPWMRSKWPVGTTSTEASRIASSNGYGGNALSAGTFQAAWARGANVVLQPGVTG